MSTDNTIIKLLNTILVEWIRRVRTPKYFLKTKFIYKYDESTGIITLEIYLYNKGRKILTEINCSFNKKDNIEDEFNLLPKYDYLIQSDFDDSTDNDLTPKKLYVKCKQINEILTFPIKRFDEYPLYKIDANFQYLPGKKQYVSTGYTIDILLQCIFIHNIGRKKLTNIKISFKDKELEVVDSLTRNDIHRIIFKGADMPGYKYPIPNTLYIKCDQINEIIKYPINPPQSLKELK